MNSRIEASHGPCQRLRSRLGGAAFGTAIAVMSKRRNSFRLSAAPNMVSASFEATRKSSSSSLATFRQVPLRSALSRWASIVSVVGPASARPRLPKPCQQRK